MRSPASSVTSYKLTPVCGETSYTPTPVFGVTTHTLIPARRVTSYKRTPACGITSYKLTPARKCNELHAPIGSGLLDYVTLNFACSYLALATHPGTGYRVIAVMKDQAASLHQMVRRNDVDGVCEFLVRHRLPRACRASQTSKMCAESSAVPSHLKRRRNEDARKQRRSVLEQNKEKCVACRRPLLQDSKTSVTSATATTENDVTEAAYNVINRRDSLGRTPLHLAASFQRVDIARMLAEAGCDVTAADGQGRQALHEAVMKACPDLVRVLLDSGRCDVEAATSERTTPLMIAATYDYVDIARLLVTAGAQLESRDTEGRRCLHIALEEGSEACAVYFIQKAGCDVNALDRNGRSCLHLATHSPHLFSTRVIQALLTSGYDCQKDEDWLRQERQPSVFYNAQSLYHQVLRMAGIESTPPTKCDDPFLTPVAVSPSEGTCT